MSRESAASDRRRSKSPMRSPRGSVAVGLDSVSEHVTLDMSGERVTVSSDHDVEKVFKKLTFRDRMQSLDQGYGRDQGMVESDSTKPKEKISLDQLFANNVRWARKVTSRHPEFFKHIAKQQHPEFLWIGCSDSRVAANEIVGLIPGELFVHRNVANVVAHTDFNCLSVMQYAVDVLLVKNIIVCGHYGCGGVLATMKGHRAGLVDNWLRHVDDVQQKHKVCLDCHTDETEKGNHLCELNVIEQANNVCRSTIVRDAWERGQPIKVHALIYGLKNGLLKDLTMTVDKWSDLEKKYANAVKDCNPL